MTDIPKTIRDHIRSEQHNARQTQAKESRTAKKFRDTARRITRKKGTNIIAHHLENCANQADTRAAQLAENISFGDQMLAVLLDYEYQTDSPPAAVFITATGNSVWP